MLRNLKYQAISLDAVVGILKKTRCLLAIYEHCGAYQRENGYGIHAWQGGKLSDANIAAKLTAQGSEFAVGIATAGNGVLAISRSLLSLTILSAEILLSGDLTYWLSTLRNVDKSIGWKGFVGCD